MSRLKLTFSSAAARGDAAVSEEIQLSRLVEWIRTLKLSLSITSCSTSLRVAKQVSNTAICTFAELSGNRADERHLRRESVIPANPTLSDLR